MQNAIQYPICKLLARETNFEIDISLSISYAAYVIIYEFFLKNISKTIKILLLKMTRRNALQDGPIKSISIFSFLSSDRLNLKVFPILTENSDILIQNVSLVKLILNMM